MRIAEAHAAVGSARRRLIARAAAHRGADGVLWGSVAGSVLAVGHVLIQGVAPGWLAALPIAGALAGVSWCMLRPPREEEAALALDRSARTEEAFLSAVSAVDSPVAFRELAAEYALERCPARDVRTFVPFATPPGAARAVVALALLLALVLVPAASANGASAPPVPGPRTGAGATGATPSATRAASPAARAKALLEALEGVRTTEAGQLEPSVRRALPELGAEDLAALARQIAAGEDGPAAAAARRALEALARGDRSAAARDLHTALGGSLPSVRGGSEGGGTGTAAPGSRTRRPGPWSASRWPLRYDRQVQRWLELAPHAEQSEHGGNR